MLQPYLGDYYWIWVIVVIALFSFILFFLENKTRSKETAARPLALTPEETQKNYETIRKYLIEKRYQPRLEQKLAGDQLFNLRVKQSSEGTSKEKSDTFRTLQGKKSGEEIKQIFEVADRRLLITGLPGAGKTSLLLHLALKLLQTEKETLAVLLNLATWSSKYATFDDWLREILPAELGVTKRYAAEILQAGKLTLLLDGLDEVAEEHRASCLKAIGEHGRQGRDYVISTRKHEYNAIEKDAPVWAQIEVLPLTKTQLLAQLDKADRRDFPEAPDLKAALEHDPLLLKVAETPFYLNTLQLLFRGGSTLSELKFSGETVEARQAEIVERFTEQALAVRSPHGYSAEQVRRWLAFFASRLTQRNKVVFELVDLQYDWWRWGKIQSMTMWIATGLVVGFGGWFNEKYAMWLANGPGVSAIIGLIVFAIVGLTYGLIVGVIAGLFVALVFGLALGLILGFAFGFLFGFKGKLPTISTKEISWAWKTFFQQLKKYWIAYAVGGVLGGIPVGLMTGILGWFFFALIFAFLSALIVFVEKNNVPIIQITTPYQRFTASSKALHFSILQHGLLRWQLYRAGVLPLRLVDFLNEMSTRHLLETDGATWRFRHRILQEYFARQWKEEK